MKDKEAIRENFKTKYEVTEAQINHMIYLYRDCKMSFAEIAKKLNIGKTKVSNLVTERLGYNRGSSFVDDEDMIIVKKLYDKGFNVSQIASEIDISQAVINSILIRKYKIEPLKGYFKKFNDHYDEIEKAIKEGKSAHAVADTVKLGRSKTIDYLVYKDLYKIERRDNIEGVLKVNYFDELNEFNAYFLGILFSIANNLSKPLRENDFCLKVDHDMSEILDILFEEIYDGYRSGYLHKEKYHYCQIIRSFMFNEKMQEYGLLSHGENVPTKYLHQFMDGYFLYRGTLTKGYFSISFNQCDGYIDLIKRYLYILGIDEDNISIFAKSIRIYKKPCVAKIISNHNIFKDMVFEDDKFKAYRKYLKER